MWFEGLKDDLSGSDCGGVGSEFCNGVYGVVLQIDW